MLPLNRGSFIRKRNRGGTHARDFLQSFADVPDAVLASHSADLQVRAAGGSIRSGGVFVEGCCHSIAVFYLLAQYTLTDQQSTIIESSISCNIDGGLRVPVGRFVRRCKGASCSQPDRIGAGSAAHR